MAALTTTTVPVAVRCPLCGTPVELTVTLTPGLIEDVRMQDLDLEPPPMPKGGAS